MKSVTTERFRKAFAKLPPITQDRARLAYQLWKKDPYNSTLQFKQVHTREPIFSVRIGLAYRALGIKQEETMIWFWIVPMINTTTLSLSFSLGSKSNYW